MFLLVGQAELAWQPVNPAVPCTELLNKGIFTTWRKGKIIKTHMNAQSGHTQPDHTSPDCKGFKDMSIKVFRGHGKAETGMKERQAPENLMVIVLHADASPDGDGNGKLEAGPTSTFLSLEGTH